MVDTKADEPMTVAKAEEQQSMGVGSILATYVVMMNGHVFRNPKVFDAEKLSAVETAYVVMQRTHLLVMEEMTAHGIKPASKVVEADLEKTAMMFAAKILETWAPRDTSGDVVLDSVDGGGAVLVEHTTICEEVAFAKG